RDPDGRLLRSRSDDGGRSRRCVREGSIVLCRFGRKSIRLSCEDRGSVRFLRQPPLEIPAWLPVWQAGRAAASRRLPAEGGGGDRAIGRPATTGDDDTPHG